MFFDSKSIKNKREECFNNMNIDCFNMDKINVLDAFYNILQESKKVLIENNEDRVVFNKNSKKTNFLGLLSANLSSKNIILNKMKF